ncbi:hypothetical protein UlMin_023812 [Ulmus minor]
MSSLGDIVDDVNPVDETAPDVLALMELFKSQNSNQSAFTKYEDSKSTPYNILAFVGDLIRGSTQIVDEVLQGSEAHTEKEEEKGPPTFTGWKYLNFFSSTMYPLPKQIVCEMKECKNGVEPDEKAKTILSMLPEYSWTGKAELTLAAFAVAFGDFCVFAKINHLVYEQVLKSSAIQKGEPFFANSSELLKRQVIIHQIKEIIETILQVMQKIDWYLREPLKMEEIVNLIITTVVACAIEVSNLTSDKKSDESQNLSPYLKQIQEVFNTIEKERDEFINHCEAIKKLQDSRTDTVEILKAMFFLNDNQPELIDASASHEPVKIDVLRGKNVFLFISSLYNVSKNNILDLKAVYEETKKDNDYTIVWIPIVEEWTDEYKLDTILSFSNQMFWYVLPSFSLSVNGIRFIKDNWYDYAPALLLLNPQGNLENRNVSDDIRKYGMEFFPFDQKAHDILNEVCPSMVEEEEERFIFFYGGEDDKWIQQFTEKATAVAEDTFLKAKYIKIEYFYVGKTAKGKALHRIVGKFWASVVARLLYTTHKEVDPVTQVIKQLRSNENLSQWAVLCKDSSVVISGNGSRFLTVLDEFDQWKEALDEKNFDLTFKEYHEARTSPQ